MILMLLDAGLKLLASEGLKEVKLTVIDESESHSATMEINVANAPNLFNQDSTSMFGIITVVLTSLIGYLYYTRRIIPVPEKEKDSKIDEFDLIDFDDSPTKETDQDSLFQNLPRLQICFLIIII